MKFPISRESLQAFDYAKEQEELREEEIQKRLGQILEQLCVEFKQSMPSNSKEKRFVWRRIDLLTQLGLCLILGNALKPMYMPSKDNVSGKDIYNIHEKASRMEYLPQFIEKLKEVFIGCDIIVDPLKTYIIIDWS
jgi:hypothetical protein